MNPDQGHAAINSQSTRIYLRWTNVLAFALAAGIAFSFSFTPLRTSHDEFWHLKTGQWIFQHGYLPINDIFTYTAANIPWHNHEWLTQLAMWGLYCWGEDFGFGGWRAIILFKSIFIVLAYVGFGLVLARHMRQPLWAALAGATAAALARRTFYPRPPYITYLLMAVVLWLFIEWRAGRLRERWLWLLLPIFALWTNLHGGWQAGLLIAGAFWADGVWSVVLAKLFKRTPDEQARAWRGLSHLTLLLAGCLVATLANPYGYRLYGLAWRVMGDRYLTSCIGELAPPEWRFVWALEGVILLLAAAAIRPVRLAGFCATAAVLLGMHFVLRASANPWLHTAVALPVFAAALMRCRAPGWFAHLLLVCFFGFQGIHHVRHLPLMAVVVLPALAWALDDWAGALARRRGPDMGVIPQVHRLAPQILTQALGLATLIGLTVFWGCLNFDQYWKRNQMLANGIELQPEYVDSTGTHWPIPSSLPRGRFLIDPYPIQAVNFMLRAALPAPLWNGGNNAGYLIWRLSPEKYKVFTDNRYDIYGGLVVRQEHSVVYGWTTQYLKSWGVTEDMGFYSWDKVLDHWKVQTIFIGAEAPGNIAFAKAGWVRVWEDYAFNLWVRDTPANRPAIERAQSLTKPLPPVRAILSLARP